jgi:hypothetical protein
MSLEPGETAIGSKDNTGLFAVIGGGLGAVAGAVIGGFAAGAAFSLAGAAIGGPIGLIVGFIIGGLFGKSKSTQTTTSPQSISRQWTKLKDDRGRFAIGIRDINIYSYQFAEISEIVSKPFSSPAPISKLALTVDEQIPTIFYSDPSRAGTENDWIKYYISIDNGTSWVRISPMHHRTTATEDGTGIVPEIININSDVPVESRDNPSAYIDTAEAVYDVRFKAVLSRPTDISGAESYTPVLSRYALQIYPLGGL